MKSEKAGQSAYFNVFASLVQEGGGTLYMPADEKISVEIYHPVNEATAKRVEEFANGDPRVLVWTLQHVNWRSGKYFTKTRDEDDNHLYAVKILRDDLFPHAELSMLSR